MAKLNGEEVSREEVQWVLLEAPFTWIIYFVLVTDKSIWETDEKWTWGARKTLADFLTELDIRRDATFIFERGADSRDEGN